MYKFGRSEFDYIFFAPSRILLFPNKDNETKVIPSKKCVSFYSPSITPLSQDAEPNNEQAGTQDVNKMSVCKTVMPPFCHIDTGSGTVH